MHNRTIAFPNQLQLMHYYSFSIKAGISYESISTIIGNTNEYEKCDKCSDLEIYHRIIDGQITNIICHAVDQLAANKAVEIYLLLYKQL